MKDQSVAGYPFALNAESYLKSSLLSFPEDSLLTVTVLNVNVTAKPLGLPSVRYQAFYRASYKCLPCSRLLVGSDNFPPFVPS